MLTFKEIVYMVLDQLKLAADDSYYTEEHIIFLADKMRAMLLYRKYKGGRNQPYQEVAESNYQDIELDLEQTEVVPSGCHAGWLRTKQTVPDIMEVGEPKAYVVDAVINDLVTFIPVQRMPYVGYNKWLKNIIYVAKGSDNHLYLHSNNPQAAYLQKVKMSAVFEDSAKAAEQTCEACKNCDVLDMTFPLEDSLVPTCIEYIVMELSGARYAPQDKDNNAKDDMSDAAMISKPNTPAVKTSREGE